MLNFDFDKKICLIKQPAGLGDILYSQKIAKYYKNQGYRIDWYVLSSFMWIKDYIKGINFLDKQSEDIYSPLDKNQLYYNIFNLNHSFSNEEMIYLPLLFAHHHYPSLKVMNAKYKMANVNDDNWSTDLVFKRFCDKENDLYYNKLNLADNEEYCFIANKIGSDGKETLPVDYNGNLRKIYLDYIPGFTLIDWCKVIENATEIHLSDSAISIITEKLNLKTNNLYMYSRRKKNYSEINYLYQKKYKYV